ncbi:hypothetical protein Vretimale_18904, partial [Volvox reticuliferus]
ATVRPTVKLDDSRGFVQHSTFDCLDVRADVYHYSSDRRIMWARALPLYESRQVPDAAALMGLVTFGAPYQYAQDMPGHNLWQANIRFIPCLHRDAGPLGVLAANVPIGAGHRTELYMCRC